MLQNYVKLVPLIKNNNLKKALESEVANYIVEKTRKKGKKKKNRSK